MDPNAQRTRRRSGYQFTLAKLMFESSRLGDLVDDNAMTYAQCWPPNMKEAAELAAYWIARHTVQHAMLNSAHYPNLTGTLSAVAREELAEKSHKILLTEGGNIVYFLAGMEWDVMPRELVRIVRRHGDVLPEHRADAETIMLEKEPEPCQ